jgi:tetratricopeptide (TPR) repeat protein
VVTQRAVIALTLVFLAQAPAPSTPPTAADLVQKLDSTAGLKEKDKPFEIAASLGRLYFAQGRYSDAQLFYKQALTTAEDARTLYLAQRRAVGPKSLPVPASVGCEPKADSALAQQLEKIRGLVALKNTPAAVSCLRAALLPVMDVEVMYGNTQFLMGDAAAATLTFTRALETFESNAEARYSRAAVTLDAFGDDVLALGRAKADFERFLQDAPRSPHASNAKRLLARTQAAIGAGGLSKLTVTAEQIPAPAPMPRQPGQAPVLSKETMEAFQNAPRTPQMQQNFEKLIADAEEHLAHARYQEALDTYKQVMPYQPDNARLRAGMAWTMVRLNRQPMADNVWRVATQAPDAVAELGDMLKAKGDTEQAKAVWQRLKDTVPAYAPKLDGKL